MSAAENAPAPSSSSPRRKIVVHMAPAQRGEVLEELDTIVDHLRVVDAAVVGVEHANDYGTYSHDAVRTVLRGIIERVENLKASI